MWACWGRADHVVDLLVNEYECDLRCKDKNGLTPLHIACAHSRPEAPVVVGHLVAPGGTFLSQRHMLDTLGAIEGAVEGSKVGDVAAVGACVGFVGDREGDTDGLSVGDCVGLRVGACVGAIEGDAVGLVLGLCELWSTAITVPPG